jgi:hypothetical protein
MAIQKLNEKHVALTFGSICAIVHAVWVIFVAVGYGPTLVNWMLGLHSLQVPVQVITFNGATAAALIALAFLCATLVGYGFATIWNFLAMQKWIK